MASSSSSSNYHVFLSFRGADTRYNFTDHLYKALVEQGVEIFRDKEEIKDGNTLERAILPALEGTQTGIPIFSKNYADSKWCLIEVTRMVERWKDNKMTILPVFYNVKPSEVREIKGEFGDAFENLIKAMRKGDQSIRELEANIEGWKHALGVVAEIKGIENKMVADGYETGAIDLIVGDVMRILKLETMDVAKHPVGMDSRVKDMMKVLKVESGDGGGMVGIVGMGGLGKTTLAKALFNRLHHMFQGSSFLSNIKDRRTDLCSSQKQLLRNVLNNVHLEIYDHEHQGKALIRNRLCKKRVLLVLDDVDHREQLDALAGEHNWFGAGSLIIITTRNGQLLKEHGLKDEDIHEPKALDEDESLELFCKYAPLAPQQKSLQNEYENISRQIAPLGKGIPLAIQVCAGMLVKPDVRSWWKYLDRMKKTAQQTINETLKLSFDSIDDENEKRMFLDIACLLIGCHKDDVIYLWEGQDGFDPYSALDSLVKRSLVKVDKENKLQVHDLPKEMAWKIVEEEALIRSDHDPNMINSRIWHSEAAQHLLRHPKGKGIDLVEGMIADFGRDLVKVLPRETLHKADFVTAILTQLSGTPDMASAGETWNMVWATYGDFWKWYWGTLKEYGRAISILCCEVPKELKRQSQFQERAISLRILRVLGHIGTVWNLLMCAPPSLRLLEWQRCPLTGLSYLDNLLIRKITVLNLAESQLLNWHPTEVLWCLRVLNLSSSPHLNRVGGFENTPNLVKLSLDNTPKLETIDESIGSLSSLYQLSISNCNSLIELPNSIWGLSKLEELSLEGITCVGKLPDKFLSKASSLPCLKVLKADDCQIPVTSAERASKSSSSLESVSLRGNGYIFKSLPEGWGQMMSVLKVLLLDGAGITQLPNSVCQLEYLEVLSLNNCWLFEGLPIEIGRLTKLRRLSLLGCDRMKRLPTSIGNLIRLTQLILSHSGIKSLPTSVGSLGMLEQLRLEGCRELRQLPSLSNLYNLRVLAIFKSGIRIVPSSMLPPQELDMMDFKVGVYLTNQPPTCNYNFNVLLSSDSMVHDQETQFIVSRFKSEFSYLDIQTAEEIFESSSSPEDEISFCRVVVVLLSRIYLRSAKCLEGLKRIMESQHENKHLIVPVFLGIDNRGQAAANIIPSEVRSADPKILGAVLEVIKCNGYTISSYDIGSSEFESEVTSVLDDMGRYLHKVSQEDEPADQEY